MEQDVRVEDTPGARRYPVMWVEMELEPSGHHLMVGICGNSRRIYTVAHSDDILTLIAVRDLYVGPKGCEERRRCMHTDCPFNRTSREGFVHAVFGVQDDKDVADMPWPHPITDAKHADELAALWEKFPNGGIILPRKDAD